jgi:hypothetical protein
MANMIGLWSNDPEFYNMILGGDELVGKIFIKENSDPKPIIDRFKLIGNHGLYLASNGNHRYICAIGDSAQELNNKISTIINLQ